MATEAAGRRTNYRLTAAGVAELNRRRVDLAGVEERIAATARRLDVELVLQQFNDGLQSDLRRRALHGPLSPAVLETVRTALDHARATIGGALEP